jgi:putative ABC transport system permease protein
MEPSVQTFWKDLRLGFRLIAKQPIFSFVAILALATGIGANTTIFSMVNGVLLRPLPYREPGNLYLIREVVPMMGRGNGSWPANLRNFDIWQHQATSFEQMAVVEPLSFDWTLSGEARQIDGAHASANIFDVLGVRPQLGRNFLANEDSPGHDQVVILTDSFWRDEMHADHTIIGRSISLNGASYQIIGVLPKSFRFPTGAELGPRIQFGAKIGFFKPLGTDASQGSLLGGFRFATIARVKPNVSAAQARADLNVVFANIARQAGASMGRKIELEPELIPLESQVLGSSRRGLMLLLASVTAVLLIVCVNLASLLLARASGRMHEMAVRSALGATRGRLIWAMVAETLPLSISGGIAGIGFAAVALRWLVSVAPIDLPRLGEVHLDWRVFLFAFGLSLFSGVLVGALPAWRCSRVDPQRALSSGGTRATSDRSVLWLRHVLVGGEVALTVVLLVFAAALTESLVRVLRVDKGFDVDRVLTVDVTLPPQEYSQSGNRLQFYERVQAALRELPVVRNSGWVSKLPLEGQANTLVVNVPGYVAQDYEKLMANYRFTSPAYFESIGIPLVEGRLFELRDQGKDVAVISRTVAVQVWPGEDPIGKQFHPGPNSAPLTEVIGVVGDIRTVRLDQPPISMVYLPYWGLQAPQAASLVIRSTTGDAETIAADVRDAITKVDPSVPILNIRSMEQIVSDSVSARRFQMLLADLFAGCALFLAALGIYSVVAYSVEQRKFELGLRMALGASPSNLRRLIIKTSLTPVAIGLISGIGASLFLRRLISSLLFGVSGGNPLMLVVVSLSVLAIGVTACSVPTARMARIDPMVALRSQ